MRRCVFLAVLLSLVLSLSKETSSETSPTSSATGSATTVASSETPTTSTATTTPTTTVTSSETPTTLTATTTPTTTVTSSATTPASDTTTTQTTTVTSSETPTTLTATTTPTTTVTSSETPTTLTATPTPTTTVTSSETPTTLTATTTQTTTVTSSETPTTLTATTTPTTTVTSSETPTTLTATTTPTTTVTSSATTPASDTTTTQTTTVTSSETPTTLTATTTQTTTVTSSETPTTLTATTTPTTTVTSSETTPASDTTTTQTTTVTSSATTSALNTTTASTEIGTNTTSSATTPARDFCNPNPCGQLPECIALHSTHTCQCPYGFYFRNKDCYRGKIFPGVIELNEIYSENVQTVNSSEYEKVFQIIETFFKNALINLNFVQTVIVEIQPVKEGRSSLPMSVTVINLFMENSTVDNNTISSVISNAIESSSDVSLYRGTTYCAVFNCDARTTVCKETEGEFPECVCKSTFSKTKWDDRSCSDCSKDCSAGVNKYCAIEKELPTCKCLPNFKEEDEECVSCPVGYSGENCNNNSELILIIVGTVFGAIILSLVIAVSIVSSRAKHKKDPEKKSLIKPGYSSQNTSDERQNTMFPRVQTTSGHANPGYQPNNPYEMPSSNRDRFPERDYDDLYEISREPEGFRMQKRY